MGLLNKKIKIQNKSETQDIEIQVPNDAFVLNERDKEKSIYPCFIDPFLCNKMRIHQKEGIKFMFECITGFRGQDISGCILAVNLFYLNKTNLVRIVWV